jgi:hypothetical protein
MEETERWLKHQHRVYCLGKSPVEGNPSKRARVHWHTQAWARYRGLLEKYQEGHLRILLLSNQQRQVVVRSVPAQLPLASIWGAKD